jgi:hypothetical protein
MILKKFLKNNSIRTSNYGNICINDIVNELMLSNTNNNNSYYKKEIEYYLLPKLCYDILCKYKNPSEKLSEFLILADEYMLNNYDYLKNLSIYLISIPERMEKNEYKLGKSKLPVWQPELGLSPTGKFMGSLNKLISRYITPLIIPLVFCFIKVNNYAIIETKILEELDEFRIININGNKSEWIRLDRNKIMTVIQKNINKFDNDMPLEIYDNTKLPKEMLLNNSACNSVIFGDNNILKYNGKEITVIIDDKNMLWFSAINIARIFQYSNPRNAILNNVNIQDKKTFDELKKYINNIPKNAQPHSIYINESGLYSLVLNSKKPIGKEFRQWITSEVLPSIRKTGTYIIKDNPILH